MELEKLLQISITAAREAGDIARDRFQDPGVINSKGFRDVITEIDLAAQACIVKHIQTNYPDHGFLTEEEDSSLPAKGAVIWIIDPLDGTINYSRQIPLYCVSIAAAKYNDPLTEADLLLGVIYDPVRDELFSAVRGQPAHLNGSPIRTSTITSLGEADICHDWHRYHDIRTATHAGLTRLIYDVKSVRGLNTAALAMAWVAAGRLDAYFNYGLFAWDIAAASLLVRQAGGQTMGIGNKTIQLNEEMIPYLASNGPLHDELSARL